MCRSSRTCPGGVDSSLMSRWRARFATAHPDFTIRIDDRKLDETGEAAVVSKHLGCKPTIVNFGADEVLATYPRLVRAAESPVIDTSCAALLLLAQEVHVQGFKVVSPATGRRMARGYPWYKVHKMLGYLDVIPGLRLSDRVRRLFLQLGGSPVFRRLSCVRRRRRLASESVARYLWPRQPVEAAFLRPRCAK